MPFRTARVLAGLALSLATALSNAATAQPVSSTHFVQLGDHHVEFSPNNVQVQGTPRPAIRFVPFTEVEVRAMAPAGRVRGEGRGTEVLVRLPSGDRPATRFVERPAAQAPAVERWVPMGRYVSEINGIEGWLNRMGYTLRDSQAGRRGAPPMPRPAYPRDLGLRLALVQAPFVDKHVDVPATLPNTRLPIQEWLLKGHEVEVVSRPALRNATDAAAQKAGVARGGLPGTTTRTPLTSMVMPTGVAVLRPDTAREAQLRSGSDALRLVAGIGSTRPTSFTTPVPGVPGSGQCPPQACTLQMGVNGLTLSTIGQQIVDDVKFDHATCNIQPPECDDEHPYTNETHTLPLPFHHWTTSAREDYAGLLMVGDKNRLADFLAGWQDPCKMKALFGEEKFAQLYQMDPLTDSDGQTQVLGGQDAANFFDGVLMLKTTTLRDCVPQVSGNEFFGAALCASYASDNSYAPSAGFHVDNSAGLEARVTIFGVPIPLIDGDAHQVWNQPVGTAEAGPGQTPVKLMDATEQSTLDPYTNQQHYIGPTALIPLGPVNLEIKSFLDASVHVGAPQAIFASVPLLKGQAGDGKVGIQVGADGQVDVGLDAGLNVLVASAGVEGDLTLLKASADGSMTTTFNPLQNFAREDKGYEAKAGALDGTLRAYVEVDLLLYSKRWTVDLASFDGPAHDYQPPTKSQVAHSVVPATASTECH